MNILKIEGPKLTKSKTVKIKVAFKPKFKLELD